MQIYKNGKLEVVTVMDEPRSILERKPLSVIAAALFGSCAIVGLLSYWGYNLDNARRESLHLQLPLNLRKYDVDRNGSLDFDELRLLLKDYELKR